MAIGRLYKVHTRLAFTLALILSLRRRLSRLEAAEAHVEAVR